MTADKKYCAFMYHVVVVLSVITYSLSMLKVNSMSCTAK